MSCGTRKLLSPYLYLAPALILLGMLMLFPMIVVLRYSVLDNVIMNKNPGFAGFRNYRDVLTNPTFRISLVNTLYFTVMSVLFHLLAGLTFAMLLNSPLVNRTVKSILRVFYILPWVFTAAVIAILWRLLLSPAGVVNYILSTSIEWFSSSKTALHALTFVNIWAGYPFFMVSFWPACRAFPAISTKPPLSTAPTKSANSGTSPFPISHPSSSASPCSILSGQCRCFPWFG